MNDGDAEHRKGDQSMDAASERLQADSQSSRSESHGAGALRKASDALEKRGVLPPIDLHHGGKEWTVAVDLTASQPGTPDAPDGFGSHNKMKQLKALAESTKDRSVNFVVRMQTKPDSSPGSGGKLSSERYFIHDGKIQRLSNSTAKNPADDLKGLLLDADKISPSSKLALIVQGHGSDGGMSTDHGVESLNDIHKAIKDGLKGSEHDGLDVLDFDACSMAALPVLDKMSDVAKHIVSSESQEGANAVDPANPRDGQSLTTTIKSLLDNPRMDGGELAKSIVDSAKAGGNGSGEGDATQTLSHYDTKYYQDFKNDLDKFGKALDSSLNSKSNFDQIKKAIDNSLSPNTVPFQADAHERDVKSFATNILNEIKDGKITGDSRELKESAERLVTDLQKLAPDVYGDKQVGFGDAGGLTANIPGSEILDSKTLGELSSPIHRFKNMVDMESLGARLADKDNLANGLKDELHQDLDHAPERLVKPLKQALVSMQQAKTERAFEDSLTQFKSLLESDEHSPEGRRIAQMPPEEVRRMRSMYDHSRAPISSGWDRFVRKLEKSED